VPHFICYTCYKLKTTVGDV